MWKDYSSGYVKRNRASSVSIMIAAFIATLFLSLLCNLAYNFWLYEIESIVLEEGNWQGRIAGNITEQNLKTIKNFEQVKVVSVNEELSENNTQVIDIQFDEMKNVYEDMPLIAKTIGVNKSAVSYHENLLSMYMIYDPQDETLPLLLIFYLLILLAAAVSLILIIHNSFAVSMNSRMHQLGVLSSIGATPKQIRICLVQEAMILTSLPIILSSLVGVLITYGMINVINIIASNVVERHDAVFHFHIMVYVIVVLISFLTVFISAWIPARKMSKVTPLQAVQNVNGFELKRKKSSHILSLIFGIKGELAGNALKAQRKALRTSTVSLTLSFLCFTIMMCFLVLSKISTNHTYFERYQEAWDVMASVQNADIKNFDIEEIDKIENVEDAVIYQKSNAISFIDKSNISDEIKEIGGLETIAGKDVDLVNDTYSVSTPLVIMDDSSFENYCEQIGLNAGSQNKEGCIVLNRIWDNTHSNFRYKRYVPFVKETVDTIILKQPNPNNSKVEIPVIAYTQEPPVLREEYDNYSLVQVISLSTWNKIADKIGNNEQELYIRILAKDDATIKDLETVEEGISGIIGAKYTYEIENRIQEKKDNDNMISGYMIVIGGICTLLAAIGIANVFSNTLSFLRQRRQEFARYMSIGMTPNDIKKMFFIEVLVIAGRPILITLPLTIIFVDLMITSSYLNPMEFIANAPILPIGVFIFMIWGFVVLAYYVGGKRILNSNLVDGLKNDAVF